MPSSFGLSRRNLFGAAGVAGLAASAPVALTSAAKAAEAAETGGLLAWLRVAPDGAVRVSAATLVADGTGPTWHTVGPADGIALSLAATPGGGPASLQSWQGRQEACAAARDVLVKIAARRWDVSLNECQAAQGRIFHARSGRQVGYRIWTEIA